jgi:RNA polymerase sigma factor (sigma-70 family)
MEPPDHTDPTDEALMARVCTGDEPALGVLMGRWELPLKRFLYRLVFNSTEAEELAQETFVKVFLNRAAFREGARFSPWILTIAANLARNRRRWWRRHPTQSLDGAPADAPERRMWELPDPSIGPAEQVLVRELAAAVRAAVAALPHELREVVVLAEFEDKSHAEIAIILGCSAKAVEMRLYRARERLRKTLGRGAG